MPWKTTDDGLIVAIRLTPKGGRDRLDEIIETDTGNYIKARVSAPPVDGAANKALIKLLSKIFGVPKSKIRFISGETSRIKRISIEGDPTQLTETLLRIVSGGAV